jgi:Putative prokaryotic signal transducing protein
VSGGDLDPHYELQRLVTVATFSTPWEAQVAQARLGAEGIVAMIADEHVIRMVALSNAIGGIQLKVREQDAAAAAEALRRLAPLPEIYLLAQEPAADADASGALNSIHGPGALHQAPAEPRCPACGSTDLQLERSSRMMLGVLPVGRKGYRCGDCGVLWKTEEVAAARTPSSAGGAFGEPAVPPRNPTDSPDPAAPIPTAPEDAPLTTVARFHTPWEAHLASTLLESEGVRSCVLEERLPAVNLLSTNVVACNRLEVRQSDAPRAAQILARAWSQPPLAAVPDLDADEP